MKRKIRNIYAYIYMCLNKADIFHDIFSILAYRIKKKSKNDFNKDVIYCFHYLFIFLLVLNANVCTSKN